MTLDVAKMSNNKQTNDVKFYAKAKIFCDCGGEASNRVQDTQGVDRQLSLSVRLTGWLSIPVTASARDQLHTTLPAPE